MERSNGPPLLMSVHRLPAPIRPVSGAARSSGNPAPPRNPQLQACDTRHRASSPTDTRQQAGSTSLRPRQRRRAGDGDRAPSQWLALNHCPLRTALPHRNPRQSPRRRSQAPAQHQSPSRAGLSASHQAVSSLRSPHHASMPRAAAGSLDIGENAAVVRRGRRAPPATDADRRDFQAVASSTATRPTGAEKSAQTYSRQCSSERRAAPRGRRSVGRRKQRGAGPSLPRTKKSPVLRCAKPDDGLFELHGLLGDSLASPQPQRATR